MSLFSIIKKNFKLLIRSKASAFIVLLGPLIVILLVGLVFSTKTSYELSIGYYSPEDNNLTRSFVQALQNQDFYVHAFESEQACVKKIEDGLIHTCVVFPEGFAITEEAQDLRFLVDYSRMNLVYKVIDSVSEVLELESEEVSYSLTQVLLSSINKTLEDVSSELLLLEEKKPLLNLLLLDLSKAEEYSESMKLEMGVDILDVDEDVTTLNKSLADMQEQSLLLINQTNDLLELIDDCGCLDENETAELEEEVDELINSTLKLHNSTSDDLAGLYNSLSDLGKSLEELGEDLEQSRALNQNTQSRIESAKDKLVEVQAFISNLESRLEQTRQSLEGIAITRAETIVSPVNTRIEPITAEDSKAIFTFPFLLVLMIMFVALLLSSTLIIFEKKSKAFFRNQISPPRRGLFLLTTFLTSLITLLFQVLIILGLANLFLSINLFKNTLMSLVIVTATITFFILLGMLIGYLFSTQEGVIMTDIVLAAVFLFLSNLVVPLESLAPWLTNVIQFNPYVLASEVLRKALLFSTGIKEGLAGLGYLLGASVVLLIMILLVLSWKEKRRRKTGAE